MPLNAAELLDALEHATITYVQKPWGNEAILNLDGVALLKVIHIEPGQKTSLQYHNKKEEVIHVIVGLGGVATENGFFTQGEHVRVHTGQVHRSIGHAILLEVTTPENDDVIRIEDDYGREEKHNGLRSVK